MWEQAVWAACAVENVAQKKQDQDLTFFCTNGILGKYVILVYLSKCAIFTLTENKKGGCNYEACKDIKHKEVTGHCKKRWLRRVPDILPVRL